MNQFDVYMAGSCPIVIISPNVLNKHLNTVIIAPITQTIKGYPSRVLSQFGEVALDQIRTLDKSRLKEKQGRVDASTAANIKAILATMFS